jgi:hypothetical protein
MKNKKSGIFLRRRVALATLVSCFLAVGCGPESAEVTGTVTFQGEKLESGTVAFHGPNATVVAPIKADGTYTATKVPVGPLKISVETSPVTGAASDGKEKLKKGNLQVEGGDPAPVGKYTKIPDRYADKEKSGLSLEVKPGKQQFDITLK